MRIIYKSLIVSNVFYSHLLISCDAILVKRSTTSSSIVDATGVEAISQDVAPADADKDFDVFLESWFDDFMARKPMEALRFGRSLPTCAGLASTKKASVSQIWGDPSAAAEAEGIEKDQQQLKDMMQRFGSTIGKRDLSDERHVSYILMQKKVEEMKHEHEYRAFRPPFGPLGCQIGVMGCQVQAFGMIRGRSIAASDDAWCHVALMNGLKDFLIGHAKRLEEAVIEGKPPYRLVLEGALKDCDAKLPSKVDLSGAEQKQAARSHDLFKAFEEKLKASQGISSAETQRLLSEAEKAVINGVWPAYRGLKAIVQNLLPKALESKRGLTASHEHQAKDFYDYRVKLLGVGGNAQSLHQRALQLVQTNVEEINRTASLVLPNMAASTPAMVMKALRKPYTDARYSDTDSGRDAYLKDVQGYVDRMATSIRRSADANAEHRLFFESDIPALPCEVKRIQSPSFPGLAQYTLGSIGKVNHSASVGFNVHNMNMVSKMDSEVLVYHEIVPGHHLQVTKTLTLPLPSFRRFFGDEAFAEGWAVYAEQDLSPRLAKLSTESQLGRLNMRQTKAVRMAVDTGLHALDWDRKAAEAFYVENTMITPERAAQAVDRHFAWPSQALTYAAGHQGLLKVRHAVENEPGLIKSLGKDWEAMLHKAILSHGDLPLAMLQDVVFAQLSAWRTSDVPK